MPKATVHWKYDPATRVAQRTVYDGVRAHTKFFHDVDGIPNEATGTASDPSINGSEENVNELGDDSYSVASRKADSASESSVSEGGSDGTVRGRASSPSMPPPQLPAGPLNVNQWTRRAPVVPNFFLDAPGSDAATEVATYRQAAQIPASNKSRKTASRVSGTTEAPDSMGHAGPESAYFTYQQAPTRVFECEDPKSAIRAHGKLVIERCYATENNLGIARQVPDHPETETETGLQSRFSSPAPSCLRPPPSLRVREQTPFSVRSGNRTEDRGSTPTPCFDYARWTWRTGDDRRFVGNSSFTSGETLVGNDRSKRNDEHGEDDSRSVTFSMIFGREGSPLTEVPEELDR